MADARSSHEIEVKIRVDNLEALHDKLRAAGFRELSPFTSEINFLYDLPDGSVRLRGEVLRLRKYGEQWVLTHKSKGSYGKHKSRVEVETTVADGEQLHRVLAALGYVVCFRYEKKRAEWSDGSGAVVLDITPIGNFIEIEGPAEWIDATAGKFGFAESDYLTASYTRLFREWVEATGSKAVDMTWDAVKA